MKNLTEITADAFDSGEMTTAMPSLSKAGSWKQSDLPPPVGRMVRDSWSSRMARMVSSCQGRNWV
jgi:hypothetical protein